MLVGGASTEFMPETVVVSWGWASDRATCAAIAGAIVFVARFFVRRVREPRSSSRGCVPRNGSRVASLIARRVAGGGWLVLG